MATYKAYAVQSAQSLTSLFSLKVILMLLSYNLVYFSSYSK